MKWKKVLGWALFICGILGGLYILGEIIWNSLKAIVSIIEDVGKVYGLIAAGIAIWYGKKLLGGKWGWG